MSARQTAGADPRRWSVQNRPEPKLVGLLVKGFLVASAACGALAGLAAVEVATRKWPTGRVA